MKEELLKQLKTLERDVQEIRRKLNQIGKERELWFNKKESLKKTISDLIKNIKKSKKLGDVSDEEAQKLRKETKPKRDRLRSLIVNAKKLIEEKKSLIQKLKLKADPSRIKAEIERLEKSIETEAYSPKKEQQVMSKIKELKKRYEETSVINKKSGELSVLDREIEALKKELDLNSEKVYDLSKETHEDYNRFLSLSTEISKIRKAQEEAFASFIKFKNEFNTLNAVLKEKLKAISNVRNILEQERKSREFIKKEKERKLIEEKIRKAEEKLKTRKKLTTEDLIAFQQQK